MSDQVENPWRKSSQALAATEHRPTPTGQFDVYPAFPTEAGDIQTGFLALAKALGGNQSVVLDGFVGVFWEQFREQLDASLTSLGIRAKWIDVWDAAKPSSQIEQMTEPFLGGDDPIFGTRFTGRLVDFFDSARLAELRPAADAEMTILYGCGAALAEWDGLVVYVDLPKNELQFRSRAGAVCNLGVAQPGPPKTMYKRFYFVDWVVLNCHKSELIHRVDLFVDAQHPDVPTLIRGDALRTALGRMSRNYFRVRPWFEPGPWGGEWIKRNIPQMEQDVPNYAWSFELIAPENGLMFESDGRLLELSFDWLMYYDHRAVLGRSADRFGFEFPIRFDYLDTIEGGNLSLQCHPRTEFIRRHFGETFTQDETYYIFDCEPDARVYLGFAENVSPDEFQSELEQSFTMGTELDVDRWIHTVPANKHDLFLIPNGTIHCSGRGNMVLEISATPYIFTFKMYDWLRLDLEGSPRPMNIDRAMQNLDFSRWGDRADAELVSKPRILTEGSDWRLVHLPTHAEHFYDVHRYEFDSTVTGQTDGSCHVMNLVEGISIVLETADGMRQRFNYAETFVVPAAAGSYTLTNEGDRRAMVVKAFVK